jgi:hypothetical protein
MAAGFHLHHVDIPLVVLTQKSATDIMPIKTIAFRQCSRCRTMWNSEHEKLEPGDQINITMIKIAYCPTCADDFAAEIDQPGYKRGPGGKSKRIR